MMIFEYFLKFDMVVTIVATYNRHALDIKTFYSKSSIVGVWY